MNPFPEMIADCRTLWDKGSIGFLRWIGLRVRSSYDGFDQIPQQARSHYQILIKRGRVVWGCVAQVNMSMFVDGDMDLPGVTVHSEDSYFDANPQDLADIGRAAFALKGTDPVHPELKPVAQRMTDELDHTVRAPMPASLTDGRHVFMGITIFHRLRLPGRMLKLNLFPMVIAPESTEFNMVLPLPYWSPKLCQDWGEVLGVHLDALPIHSTGRQVALAADKAPVLPERPHWDVKAMPVYVTPSAVRGFHVALSQVGVEPDKVFLMVRLGPDGFTKHADIVPKENKKLDEISFSSNGIEVLVRRDQIDQLRGSLVDFKDSMFGPGFLIRLPGE